MVTVLEWVKHLETKIEEQKRYAAPWENRYQNKYALPFIAREYMDVYGDRGGMSEADASWMLSILEAPKTGTGAITVDALGERLTVLGGTSDDKATERAIAAAWEDNDLDVMHREAHRDAMVRRESYGVISRSADGRRAIATIESSEQAAVHRMAAPPYDVDAYFKVWRDEWTGDWHGLLLLPGREIHLEQGASPQPDPEGSTVQSRWSVVEEFPRTGPVPVVQFTTQARLLEAPKSLIEPIYTTVDLADLVDGLMVFAGHFGAVPIRWGTGIDVPRDPKDPSKPLLGPDGKPAMGFKPRADHFWFTSNDKGSFGQMVPASLDTYVSWGTWVRSLLRSQTKVAAMYYAFDLKSHMTAELLKTDEAPMVRTVNAMGMSGPLNQAWRRYLNLLAQHEGHTGRVRPLWEDPQTRMEAPAVDAFQKAVASGIGVVSAAVEFLGWTREKAEKAVEEAQEEAKAAAEAGDPLSLLDPATRARLKLVKPNAPADQPSSA